MALYWPVKCGNNGYDYEIHFYKQGTDGIIINPMKRSVGGRLDPLFSSPFANGKRYYVNEKIYNIYDDIIKAGFPSSCLNVNKLAVLIKAEIID